MRLRNLPAQRQVALAPQEKQQGNSLCGLAEGLSREHARLCHSWRQTGRDRNGETGRDTERQGEAERDGKRQRERNRETEKERRCKLMTAAKLVCGAKIDCGGKTKSGSVMSQTACLHITDDVFHSGTSANTQPQDILFLHATCPSLLSLRVCLCHDELHLGLVCLVIELVAWLVLSLPSWLPSGLSVCLVRLTGAQSLATIQGHI